MGKKRIYEESDADSTMGVDRRVSVNAEFDPKKGFTLRGADLASWPARDLTWSVHVAPDQTDKFREALGAEAGEDMFEVILDRFDDGTLPVGTAIADWFKEHGIECTKLEEWHDKTNCPTA